jgi:hypothetical protein
MPFENDAVNTAAIYSSGSSNSEILLKSHIRINMRRLADTLHHIIDETMVDSHRSAWWLLLFGTWTKGFLIGCFVGAYLFYTVILGGTCTGVESMPL